MVRFSDEVQRHGERYTRYFNSLKQNNGDFDSVVRFSDEVKMEMMWWKNHIKFSYNDMDSSHEEPAFRRIPDWQGMFL